MQKKSLQISHCHLQGQKLQSSQLMAVMNVRRKHAKVPVNKQGIKNQTSVFQDLKEASQPLYSITAYC